MLHHHSTAQALFVDFRIVTPPTAHRLPFRALWGIEDNDGREEGQPTLQVNHSIADFPTDRPSLDFGLCRKCFSNNNQRPIMAITSR